MDHLTIGQLARDVGVPTSTVRYYERRGLLEPAGRSGGNYRLYTSDTRDRLRWIRAAQAAGFTLKDITALLRFRDGDTAPCRQVQDLIEHRLGLVAAQIDHLTHVQKILQQWSRACAKAEKQGRCAVLEGLDRPLSGGSNNQSQTSP